jgi:sulfonate transport system permease protein
VKAFRQALTVLGPALVLIAGWKWGLRTGWIDPVLLPQPDRIGRRVLALALGGDQFYRHAAATLRLAGGGLLLGLVAGVPLGAWMGISPRSDRALLPYVEFTRALPAAALIPITMVLFSRDVGRILVVAVPSALVLVVSCRAGVRSGNRMHWDLARLYGLSRATLFRRALIWDMLPSALAGLRLALSLGLVVATVVEMLLGAEFGLGDLLLSSQPLDKPTMYAVTVLLGGIGYGLNAFAIALERRGIAFVQFGEWRSQPPKPT